jgi:hypothetical protein
MEMKPRRVFLQSIGEMRNRFEWFSVTPALSRWEREKLLRQRRYRKSRVSSSEQRVDKTAREYARPTLPRRHESMGFFVNASAFVTAHTLTRLPVADA